MIELSYWLLPILIVWIIGLLAADANWGGAHVNWLDGWTRILCRSLHGLGKQRVVLPEKGPAIIVANHVSGLDPLLLIAASKRPLRFLIAREEYQRFGMQWLFRAAGCIPVDRSGQPEKSLRQANKALQRGEVIAIFPHGKIHLDHDPARKLKAGCVRLAYWSQSPIIPVRIDGVGAPGKILMATIWPSNARLHQSQTILVDQQPDAETLKLIQAAIGPSFNC